MSGLGHNKPPRDRSFKKRWASAIFDCADPKKPVGAVAMAFRIYHDMDGSGFGVAASDLEIARACGVSDRSVRTFKAWLVASGFVRVLSKGGRGGQTEYRALIPDEIELPEKSAGETEIKPEAISGKNQLNRKTLPEKENGLPEKTSGESNQPEKSAGEDSSQKRGDNNSARGEDINIYNKINNQHTTLPEQPRAKLPETAADFDKLAKRLTAACNGALDNPANCLGLANLATPIMWLEQGCDLERDVIPTLTAMGKTAHGKRIRTWNYFSGAVAQARDTRVAGLPAQRSSGAKPTAPVDDTMRQIDAIIHGGRR